MGSIHPKGDECSEDYMGFCTMFVRDGRLHMQFEEETDDISFEIEEAEFFHEKLTEALEVMRGEIQDRQQTESGTDTEGG